MKQYLNELESTVLQKEESEPFRGTHRTNDSLMLSNKMAAFGGFATE